MTPDSEEFARLADGFRPELLAHCYRMLGSVHDAEDQVQETLVRAWRAYGDFEGRASVRTWLYRIATNACLRALENRERRPLPSGLGRPEGSAEPRTTGDGSDIGWLQPIPDALVTPDTDDPAVTVASRVSLRLALIAALQYLPPRQRAVLLLRDVLGWRAAEVADLLGTTSAAVNSSLQRARAQLRVVSPAEDAMHEPTQSEQRALLERYATAFEDADVDGLMKLLRADAVFEMPPQPMWFVGRDAVLDFLKSRVLREFGLFRMLPTLANGQPALVGYGRGADGRYHAHGVQVLTIAGPSIVRVTSFNDPALVTAFGFPPDLPGSAESR
jgi:RNA polymerase sigma-70 factor (ECF subfamily)